MLSKWKQRPRLRRDWEARLLAWAERAWSAPYNLGAHDCLLAAAAAVEAQTGRDFAEGHRGRYRSRAGAARYLRSLGFSSIESLLDSLLEQVPTAFAQRGDIVLIDGTPGVCLGAEAMIIHEGGPIMAPRDAWSKAWSVGGREVGAAQ
jgi:hypothetical protein